MRIPTFSSRSTLRNSAGTKIPGSFETSIGSKPPTPNISYIKSNGIHKINGHSRTYNRSTSAESRVSTKSNLHLSSSSHSLKSESKTKCDGLKKSSVPGLSQRYEEQFKNYYIGFSLAIN